MKNIIKSTAVLMAMMLLAGCEAFLDTESYTDRNTSNFPSSETDAIQLVTGIYSTFKVPTSTPSQCYWMTANAASDDCYGGGGADDTDIQALDYLLNTDLNFYSEFWEVYYQGIARANIAIANLDKVENEDLRNQLLGEAYFLRSFFYFELAQFFGSIPVVATIPTNVEEAAKYPGQASHELVYGTIAAGLKKAAEIMPSKKWNECITGLRHATRWDAEALLARVYLFYTGFYSDKTGQTITELPLIDLETGELISEGVKKTEVITKLEDCINNSGHSLVADFRLLWPYTNVGTKACYDYAKDVVGSWLTDDKNPEAMFQFCVSHLGSSSDSNRINQYVGIRARKNYETNGFPFSQGYGWLTVNPHLYNNWYNEEPGDPRRDASIWNVEVEGNDTYTWGNENQVEETGLWQKKYQAYGFIAEDGTFWKEFGSLAEYGGPGDYDIGRKYSPQNLQMIRFADVLLMHSELTETADKMNLVRARVGLAPVAYSQENIRKERRHELAFEAVRWSDMRRYGKEYAKAALVAQKDGIIRNEGKAPEPMKEWGRGWAQRYEDTWGFFPIPQLEIDLSAGSMTQNAGWTNPSDYSFTGLK